MFKQDKDQKILAENLQNLLLVVSGQRDEANEVENGINNYKWSMAGVFDEEGLFYLREGEHEPIQNHFKHLRLNRLQQKKALNNI